MSKQANPPPPGDKPTGSAPPRPPTWRNWVWAVTIFVILALFFLLPTRSPSTSITYSQFISDVQQHKVKSVELSGSVGGTSSGTLTDGTKFTVVIPPQAGQDALNQLTANVPQVSTAPAGQGFGTTFLVYLIVFGLPLLLSIWLFRRISRGAAAGGLGGVLGAGRSRAQGVRRGAALHHVRRRGRLRRRQGGDRRGGGLPPQA
jgi:cell division protease FtsH